MENKTVTMAHGAGGKQTSELIDQVFKAHFANADLTADDAAVLTPPAGRMAVSTDGFIVSPAFFPGGNIGKLSICGTVNDLACMGAKPLYLTCAFVIEEGFQMEKLEEIASAMEKTAKEAGVHIVSGDTKVAGKGQVDGVFITTTGIGEIQDGVTVGGELAKPGDAIIVTGDIGRHGCTILLEREDFGIEADVTSDCAPLWGTVKAVMDTTHNLHVIRDATRGGVGTVLYEIAGQSNVGIRLNAAAVPVQPEVKGVCGMLGLGTVIPCMRGKTCDHGSEGRGGRYCRNITQMSVFRRGSYYWRSHCRRTGKSRNGDRDWHTGTASTAGRRTAAKDLLMYEWGLNQYISWESIPQLI